MRYDYMQHCLKQVYRYAFAQDLSVFLPYKIGCGIAAGNWEMVKDVIAQVFGSVKVNAYVVKRQG